MTDYIKREDLLKLYDLGGLEVENAKVPLNVVIQNIKGMPSADVVEIKKEGEWDMFDLISSAYYGKGMYFKQDNGTVYSRHSGEYMTVDEAIREFISLIDIDELTDTNVGKWIPVTERLPEKTGKYLVCGQWRGKPSESWVCELIAFGKIKGWDNEARNPAVTHWMPLPRPPKEETNDEP